MDRKQVNSSNIQSIGYDVQSAILEVEFTSGDVYQYFNLLYIDYANVRPWSEKLGWHIELKRLKQFLDSFDTVEAINFYKRRKIDIGIKTLISKRNRHQIEEILKLCLKLKVKRITFISEIPSRNSDFPPKERAKALKEILVFQRRFRGVLRIQPAASLFQNIECKTGVQFCSPLDGQKIYIDWDGGMLFCPDIFFRCENKPLIQEVGFEKAYKITLDTINEIKKRRLYDLLNNSIEANTTLCDYCDKHIESCLDLAKEKYRIN